MAARMACPIRGLRTAASLKRARRSTLGIFSRPIRGLRTAASLKLLAAARVDATAAVYPRPPDRGLIEARSPSCSSPPGRRTIRGLRTAASLKRVWELVGDEREAAIRGLRTAASLKLRSAIGRAGKGRRYPRPPDRGLIEARLAARAGAGHPSYPRPPDRGLIEARMTGRGAGVELPIRGLRTAASLKPMRPGAANST